jgi:hypothetical protein
MRVLETKVIDVSADAAWWVLGEEFADIASWLNEVSASSLEGRLGKGAVRTCTLSKNGKLTERITRFDRRNKALSYAVTEGIPKMMRDMEFNWHIEEVGRNQCQVTGEITLNLAWYGVPLKRVLSTKFRNAVTGLIGQLAEEALKVRPSALAM